jgi:hypothetical protein
MASIRSARLLLLKHQRASDLLGHQLIGACRMEGEPLRVAIGASLDGIDPLDWLVRRRRLADAAGPGGFAAAWRAASRRWPGTASDESRDVYATTWHAKEERRLKDMLRRRREIEAEACKP